MLKAFLLVSTAVLVSVLVAAPARPRARLAPRSAPLPHPPRGPADDLRLN